MRIDIKKINVGDAVIIKSEVLIESLGCWSTNETNGVVASVDRSNTLYPIEVCLADFRTEDGFGIFETFSLTELRLPSLDN